MREAEEQLQSSMEIKQAGVHSRLKKRLQHLREHHDKCLTKHMEYIHSQTQKSSSDSADTFLLETSSSDTGDNPDVPPLARAESVLLTKEYLEQISRTPDVSNASVSSVESSGDEYIPAKDSEDQGSSELLSPIKVPLPKKSALQTLREGKWNTPQLLPFTEDVKIMHGHLEKCREHYQEHLKSNPNKKNWTRLATVTLAEVILFNRRREGEVSKMPLNAFTLRDTSRVHSDVALGLSKFEQKLCKHFQRIEIRGKRNRKVPILLTPDMLSSMEALVAHRQTCGVPNDNPYFFARSEANTHLRGSDAIRRMAKECGAKHPETLSSTKLRKQVSTLSTVLNLKDNEMDTLANFLGHDIRVHRQYYRLPEGTVELAKVSKVLIALEQGRLSDFTGKSLDEIEIDPSEQILEAVDSDLSETERETSFCSSGSSRSKKRCQPESDSDDHRTEGPENSDGPGSVELGTKGSTESSGSKKRRQSEFDSDDHQAVSSGTKNQPPESDDDLQIGSSRYADLGPVETVDDGRKKETSKKRSWTQREVRAVEKTLKSFIDCGKVPGKSDCTACIKASPDALKDRSWTGVKFYVKNRITAVRRDSAKRVSLK
ncbi:uncharacterized protein LOC129349183 isoform X2 [Amphiprion ocellaris]|uniref:uncharacterized protein LOC129349183 isoform X2 n=1 Tax=Amphiprion ocellaris TaxID=80972 RepID=UPI002411467C|nr:uncharacterized protein LOC129349183 isoform X2 [Amphiprion ocellaris]